MARGPVVAVAVPITRTVPATTAAIDLCSRWSIHDVLVEEALGFTEARWIAFGWMRGYDRG